MKKKERTVKKDKKFWSTLKMEAIYSSETLIDFQGSACAACFHACLLLGLFFGPEDGSVMFLRNVDFQGSACHLLSRWFLARLIRP
jgi:hypothetical protein